MKKLKLSTEPKVIKTKNIDTLEFKLIFPIEHHYDDSYYISLLRLFITSTSNKYHEYVDFRKEKLRHTILGLSFFANSYGDNTYLVFSFSLPKEGLVSDFNLEESFAFAIDAIKNPYCNDGEFNQEKFDYEKEYLVTNHERELDGIYANNANKFYETIDSGELLGNSYDRNTKLLESISAKGLYEFYKKNILDNNFISYVYGDISETKVNKLFAKYFPQKKKSITINTNYFKPLPIKRRRYEEIQTNYNQSELFMEYQADIKESERFYLAAIVNILYAQENNLIFEALRVKNNLVYDVRFDMFLSRAMFVIISFIPSDKYKETKKIIKNVFNSLKDEKYMKYCLDKLIKGLEVDLLKENDNLIKPLDNEIDKDLGIKGTKEILEEFKKIKISDLVKFLGKIELTNEMLFRGDE